MGHVVFAAGFPLVATWVLEHAVSHIAPSLCSLGTLLLPQEGDLTLGDCPYGNSSPRPNSVAPCPRSSNPASLLQFDGAGGFRRSTKCQSALQDGDRKRDLQVICDSGDSVHLVDDPASHGLEQVEGELVRLGAHEVAGFDSTEAMNQVRIHAPKSEEWIMTYMTMYP